MNQVWKYLIGPTHHRRPFTIPMPTGARIMTLAVQDGQVALWALVDPVQTPEKRTFEIFGTGWEIDGRLTYIGTWQEPPFVWHLFEQL